MSAEPMIVTLRLGPKERELLRLMPALVRRHLQSTDLSGRYAKRLFPALAEDPDERRELRKLLADDIRARKMAHLEAFESAVAGMGADGRMGLTSTQADQVLAFLADLRIVLAVTLGVTDETWYESPATREITSVDDLLFRYAAHLQSAILKGGWGIDQREEWARKRPS